MELATLRDQLAPFLPAADLDDALIASLQVHLDLLVRWNQHIDLTSVRSPEEMVVRHFGESLFAARHLLPRDSEADVFDLGSGAGFPGLPMKYWAPRLRLTLIESHGKKATFLREVARALQLTTFTVLQVRAESLVLDSRQRASLVTMRAVEKFDQSLVAAARLVAPGGRLAVLIGEAQHPRALSLLPAGTSSIVSLPSSNQRILLTWQAAQ
jgi:16S rRNA (guanine527-N7)-methyltransferase